MNQDRVLSLQVVADVICPWCFIGKRNLDQALRVLAGQGIAVAVEWLPFQLNPGMPAEGMDRREFRTRRFGWNESLAMDARAVEAGQGIGIVFRYALQSRTPNTLAAHGLVRLARAEGGMGMQGRVVDALFEAYFCDGEDIGDVAVLARIAEGAGLLPGAVDRSRAARAEIAAIEQDVRALGVGSVPSYLHNGHLLSSGSNTVEGYVRALSELASQVA